eukprot:TRINITY_DN7101_c0_g1_i1.p1 TRINITY_DN7101_c0_g1~~TRINITY_DN7101_c0_g1_i1.p1  ORF type:complete len:53 (+),score=28.47 TRINITY_DN7101_c0_g1_i1:199-357(+)
MEDLIKDKEMALTHMREQSDLQIKNLRAQLAMKGNTIELDGRSSETAKAHRG